MLDDGPRMDIELPLIVLHPPDSLDCPKVAVYCERFALITGSGYKANPNEGY